MASAIGTINPASLMRAPQHGALASDASIPRAGGSHVWPEPAGLSTGIFTMPAGGALGHHRRNLSVSISCRKNEHRAGCTRRVCGRGRDSQLLDALLGAEPVWSRAPASPQLSPRGARPGGGGEQPLQPLQASARGQPRSKQAHIQGNNSQRKRAGDLFRPGSSRSGGQPAVGKHEPKAREEARGSHVESLLEEGGFSDSVQPQDVERREASSAGRETLVQEKSGIHVGPHNTELRHKVPHQHRVMDPEELEKKQSWHQLLRARLFWIFRALGTIVD